MREGGLTEMSLSHICERMAYAGQEIPANRLRAVHVACNDTAAREIPPRWILPLLLVPGGGTGSS